MHLSCHTAGAATNRAIKPGPSPAGRIGRRREGQNVALLGKIADGRTAGKTCAQRGIHADDMIATMKETAPIRRRKLYEEVVDRLEALIREGELKPGDSLPAERELMQLFGVGRPAIREALFALNRMGLVVVANGERPRVSSPTPKTLLVELSGAARLMVAKAEGMRHFQQARGLFECALAEEAARLATRDDVIALERALKANRDAIGDDERFMRTDVAFHFAVATIPRNPIYVALHQAIVEWLVDQRSVSLRRAGTDKSAYKSHQAIFEAIESRDPAAAGEAMRQHLDEIANRYWKVKGGGE
jgi:DNA-binding FadR family transcriptional regulator